MRERETGREFPKSVSTLACVSANILLLLFVLFSSIFTVWLAVRVTVPVKTHRLREKKNINNQSRKNKNKKSNKAVYLFEYIRAFAFDPTTTTRAATYITLESTHSVVSIIWLHVYLGYIKINIFIHMHILLILPFHIKIKLEYLYK